MSLLEVHGLQVAYGGIRAVKGITLQVARGELVTLIGANGAGKSSTLRALSGLLRPAGGEIRYDGVEVAAWPAFRRARAGLVMVPEGRGVFPQLSVDDNLSAGAFARNLGVKGGDKSVEEDRERVFDLFPRLAERRRQAGGTLSGGEQQMLAIGRALMSRPQLLLLDEPSMGLAPLVVQIIFSVIRKVNAEGVAVLLVEQNARAALEIAARAYVLESGEITLSGEARPLLDDPKVKAAYLGEG
jgi:branched-chain amino acid transport system ATP-binding protein